MQPPKLIQPEVHRIPLILNFMEAFYAIDQYPFDEESSRLNLLRFLANPELGRMWIIDVEGNPAGYLALTFGFSFEYGGRDAFIDEFYLVSDYRGRGLGAQILEAVSRESKSLGVNALHLEVEITNEAGQKLYRKSGFKANNRNLLTKRL